MKKFLSVLLAVVMVLTLVACGATTEEPVANETVDYSTWPTQDIVINYNSRAGSSGDVMCRQIALACEELNLLNGHQIIVNDIIDPTGYEAWKPVTEAKPDGYTLACLSTSAPGCWALGTTKLDYRDMDYLCGFFVDPQWVVVPASAPYNTLAELFDYIKANPGKVNWGTASAVGMDALAAANLFANDDTLDVNRVSFSNGSEQLTALLGGFVDVTITEYLDVDAQVQAGNLKIIGILSNERDPSFPDVMTSVEAGWDCVLDRARGFTGPKGMDPALIARINEIFEQAWNAESFQAWMTQNCVNKMYMTGEEFLESYNTVYDFYIANMEALQG